MNPHRVGRFWYFWDYDGITEIGPYRTREICRKAIPVYRQYREGKIDEGQFIKQSGITLNWIQGNNT